MSTPHAADRAVPVSPVSMSPVSVSPAAVSEVAVSECARCATDRPGRPARALLAVVGLYRVAISPLRPPACRYLPSCSEYALDALQTWGALRGGGLALRRLLRCHPFHAGGHDPVPPRVAHTGCTHSIAAHCIVPDAESGPHRATTGAAIRATTRAAA